MMETKELFDWVLKQPCFEVFFSSMFFCVCRSVRLWKFLSLTRSLLGAENVLHAISKQVRYIWEEGSEGKSQ